MRENNHMEEREFAQIPITTRKGNFRAARSLVVRALKETVGKGYNREPYTASYVSREQARKEGYSGDEPFYEVQLTEAEARRFWEVVKRLADRDGWYGPPCDIYMPDW